MKARGAAAVAAVLLSGAALGLGSYTFVYATGWSYLTNDAAACANCHVMREQHDGWTSSSHRSVAVCNDCHVPRDLGAFQRRGQFYLDFVESENSNGFHAPQEATRLLGEAIDHFRRGQVALRPLPAQ
jgi:cytochrome c nitrite reductase small subunit